MDPRQRRLVVRELPRRVRRRRPRPRRVALPHQLRGAYPHRGCIERFNTTQPASISIASRAPYPQRAARTHTGPAPPDPGPGPHLPFGGQAWASQGGKGVRANIIAALSARWAATVKQLPYPDSSELWRSRPNARLNCPSAVRWDWKGRQFSTLSEDLFGVSDQNLSFD